MNNLMTIATEAARVAGAPGAGVAVTVLHGRDPQFVIWSVSRRGGLSEHRLSACCTGLDRLTAHAKGFVANHQADWA